MPGILENANILLPNGSLTSSARNIFISRMKDILNTGIIAVPLGSSTLTAPVKDYSKNLPIDDKSKFPDFHKIWIDGYYTSIARSLNIASNFAAPVFDPGALGKELTKMSLWPPPPPLDITASLTSIIAGPASLDVALTLLLVPPINPSPVNPRPGLTIAAMKLVKPPGPVVFNMELPADINFKPFGATDIKKGLSTIVPAAFISMLPQVISILPTLAPPLLFTLDYSMFVKQIIGLFQSDHSETQPSTGLAAAAVLASVAADAGGLAALGSTIGSGAIVSGTAALRGYLP